MTLSEQFQNTIDKQWKDEKFTSLRQTIEKGKIDIPKTKIQRKN
jgi:hypothetical protein